MNNQYGLLNNHIETLLDLFFECRIVTYTWNLCNKWINIKSVLQNTIIDILINSIHIMKIKR